MDGSMEEIHRYKSKNIVTSALDPLKDVTCWVEGLTSARYVKELLVSHHTLQGPMSVDKRSETVAGLVQVACKYLEQAENGPKEVSFLPLYYAFLNLSKAYIAIGPYGNELSKNPRHGASYDPKKKVNTLDNNDIKLWPNGAIPLLYRTLVGEDIPSSKTAPLTLKMRDVYPYINDISAEYETATGKDSRLIPFRVGLADRQGKQRIEASFAGQDNSKLDKTKIACLQGFNGLRREHPHRPILVSQWCDKGDNSAIRYYLRPAMLYGYIDSKENVYQLVPWSGRKLFLPEELPLLCAFYHMSNVVRYHPDALNTLMDSKYWPVLLALRRHGAYRFLLLFWQFVTQRCTYILRG